MTRQIKGIACPHCQTQNAAGDKICFRCGKSLIPPSSKRSSSKKPKGVSGGLLLFIFILIGMTLILGYGVYNPAPGPQRSGNTSVSIGSTGDDKTISDVRATETIIVALSPERQQITAGQDGKLHLILDAQNPMDLIFINKIRIVLTYAIERNNSSTARAIHFRSGNLIPNLPSTTEHEMRSATSPSRSVEAKQIVIDCNGVCFASPPKLPLTLYEVGFETSEHSSGYLMPIRYFKDPEESYILNSDGTNILDLKNSTDATIELE